MRALAMREGNNYTPEEKIALTDYCASDTYALRNLLPRMAPDLAQFDIREMLFRGRFMVALARSHRVGVPVDADFLRDLTTFRAEMAVVIAEAAEREAEEARKDPEHFHRWGIYERGQFKRAGYEDFIERAGIPMPKTAWGNIFRRRATN